MQGSRTKSIVSNRNVRTTRRCRKGSSHAGDAGDGCLIKRLLAAHGQLERRLRAAEARWTELEEDVRRRSKLYNELEEENADLRADMAKAIANHAVDLSARGPTEKELFTAGNVKFWEVVPKQSAIILARAVLRWKEQSK